MCEAGRIIRHLEQHIDDPRCSIVLVSYQAPQSLGHRLRERGPTVMFHGKRWNKWAEVVDLSGFSGHADHNDLLEQLTPLAGRAKVRLVHCDVEHATLLAEEFISVNENLRPYAVTGHKHIAEMEQELSVAAGSPVRVSFVPHLAPVTRGLLATCSAPLAGVASTGELLEIFHHRYKEEPFVRVLGAGELPATRRVTGTNVAEVTVRADERSGRAIAICAIDNLGKGAAGQAVQNANLMLGLDEATALDTAGLAP